MFIKDNTCDIPLKYQRTSVLRERRSVKDNAVTRVEKGMLRWFGHAEMINVSRLTAQIYRANGDGNEGRDLDI